MALAVVSRSELPVADCSSSERRACGWCRSLLEVTASSLTAFCGTKCRQAAFRFRRRRATALELGRPMRMAYADPPYPGLSSKYYGDEPTFAGEVDHVALIASLRSSSYDGWALSTSSKALRDLLPLCPPDARVCAWVKPIGVPPATNGIHSTWEPVIVVGGRQRRPGVRDFLSAQPARGGGTLPGRKPIAFIAWLFDCLGLQEGDTFDDLFPGTGIVGRAFESLTPSGPSRRYRDDASSRAAQTSPEPTADASPGDDEYARRYLEGAPA